MNCKTCGKPLNPQNTSGLCLPHFNAAHAGRARENLAKLWRKPDHREKMRCHLTMQSRSRLAWCPIEYRDEYRRLRRNTGLRAAEAREVILATVDADTRRFLATGKLQQSVRC